MKRLVVALASAVVFGSTSFAETSLRFELQNVVRETKITPRSNLYTRSKIDERFLLTTYSVVQRGYGEQFIGIIYTPRAGIEIESTVGLETTEMPFRFATSLFVTKGRLTGFGLFDYGKTGVFWKFQGQVQVFPWLSTSIFGRRFEGIGPRFDLSLPGGVGLWGAGLYSAEEKEKIALFALRRKF